MYSLLCHYVPVFVLEAEAPTQMVKATSAIERAVFITMQWVASVKPRAGPLYTVAEELKTQVKRMGGYFQLLIQVDISVSTFNLNTSDNRINNVSD